MGAALRRRGRWDLPAAKRGTAWADRDREMSIIVTMKCNLGHSWVLPLSKTSHVVIPDRCPKCIKGTNSAISAVIAFEDDGSPSITIDKE